MSVFKMVKANLITQLIWMAVGFIIFLIIGLFAKKSDVKNPTTKDGFSSQKMQDTYNHYKAKANSNGN